jgi:hypothetical protein
VSITLAPSPRSTTTAASRARLSTGGPYRAYGRVTTDEVVIRDAYIRLLKTALLGTTVGPTVLHQPVPSQPRGWRAFALRHVLGRDETIVCEAVSYDLRDDPEGKRSVWQLPPWPLTMIGERRLDNVEACIRSVVADGVPGDLIETGVWRGGTTIFMRGVLFALGVTDRVVYVADSFEGLPAPDVERYPADEGLDLHLWPNLAVAIDDVRSNFGRFDLLDDQVQFVEGWFRDTLPALRDHEWAVLRLDGDYYESTTDALENLYPGLAPGGWVIIDDYEIPACAKAVHDFRSRHGVNEPIEPIDWTGICWRKDP